MFFSCLLPRVSFHVEVYVQLAWINKNIWIWMNCRKIRCSTALEFGFWTLTYKLRRILEWVIELRHSHFFVWNVGFFVDTFHETSMQYQQQRGCIDLSKSRLATICPSSLKSKNVRNMCAFTNDVCGWFLGSWPRRRIVRNTRPNVQCQHKFFSQQNPFFVYPSFPASHCTWYSWLLESCFAIIIAFQQKHTFTACSTNSCGNCNLSTIVSAHGPCICGTYRLTTKWVKRVLHTLVIEINCMSWSSWCTLNILLQPLDFFLQKTKLFWKNKQQFSKTKTNRQFCFVFCFIIGCSYNTWKLKTLPNNKKQYQKNTATKNDTENKKQNIWKTHFKTY